MKTDVSVIIPIFNSEPYLRRCLDSVIGQSFFDKMEILLVDDGSTDGCGMICDEYASNNSVFSVIHTENQGASRARRLGLERASGEYVTFIDSDDFVSRDYVSSLYDLEKRFHFGISACKVQRIQPGEVSETDSSFVDSDILEGDILFHRFFKYEFWGLYGKLYRRSLLMSVPFPKATICEDYFVMTRLLHQIGRMAYFAKPLYYYETHMGSLSRGALSLRSFEEFDYVKAVYDFISVNRPEYRAYALSNALASAVKLILASKHTNTDFQEQRKRLSTFLAHHRIESLCCKPLNPKTRLLAFYCSF